MPFKSLAQRRWMHATHPAMAERWEKETPHDRKLPKRKNAKRKAKGRG
jgi:hypothetical protein